MDAKAQRQPASLKVAVIGSGLSAVGAIKALIKIGIKPVVLDQGEKLEEDRDQRVKSMAGASPNEWKSEQRDWLNQNETVKDGRSIPKKLEFGSGYFYGASRKEAPVQAVGNLPAFSYALGGLSCGWGASVLPPQACDLSDWPVSAEELKKYCEIVLKDIPYSAAEDGLSLNFPLLTSAAKSLRPSRAEKRLLELFHEASILKKDEVVFGQSRVLISPETSGVWTACKYCGQCMSGCVYKSIYKAGDEILALGDKGEIEYIPGCLVVSLAEMGENAAVTYLDRDGKTQRLDFDRVFLAAGAVNSTRIVMNSLSLFGEKAVLRSRGGFVLPGFSFRKLPADWPDCNTEPGLFLEFKGGKWGHWVHVQISTENELLLQKLGIRIGAKGPAQWLKRWIASHLFLIFVNYHSDHSGTYELSVIPPAGSGQKNSLHSLHRKAFPQAGVLWATGVKLLRLFLRIGCLPLLPFAKLNSGSYHVGGTMPMKERPNRKLETDSLGRAGAWKLIHAVDSSVFPSLPGTTIGLLLMANAYRIVDKVMGSHETGSSP